MSDIPIILVGGYVAHVREWVQFESGWRKILQNYGVPCFHTAEFATAQHPYKKWKEEKRKAFMSSLLYLIDKFPRMRIACSLEISDYMQVVKYNNIGRDDIARAYHMCARKCIEIVSDLARNAGHQQKILHIFDRGNAAWPSFEASFNQSMLDSLRILQPIAQSKTDVIALQSADLLAHQARRDILIKSKRVTSTKEFYMPRLRHKTGFFVHADKNRLVRWYRDETLIEAHRKILGTYPRRVTWKQQTGSTLDILRDLFAPPESHTLTRIVMEGK